MANAVFNGFKQGIIAGQIDLDTAAIKVALVRGYVFNAAHTFISDLTAAGGVINGSSPALTGITVTDGVFDAADTTITTAANSSNHIFIVYQASAVGGGADVAATAQRLIAHYDTGSGLPVVPGAGTVSVTWANTGARILKVG